VASFSAEDTLLLLCLHGSSHAWQGLMWVADVSEFVKAHLDLDWELLLQKAAQAKLSRIVLLGLHLAYTVLDAPLPEEVRQVLSADRKLSRLSQGIVVRMYKKRGPLSEATRTRRLQFTMRSGLLKLPLYLQFIAFLLRPNAQDRAAAQLPAGWGAGYYVVRPLRLIRCYLLPKLGTESREGRARTAVMDED